MKVELKAALILSLLSPFFAEVLSGSTPPLQIINPLSFFTLWGFYGAGVLLVREFWIKYNPRPMALGFLGFAYGILEEGIFVKSWFDPHWSDLGILGTYGRVWGINAVWAVWLTIFHSMMSIWVPIMVITLIFPEIEKKRFFKSKSICVLIGIYLFVGLMIYFVLNPYKPPFLQYLIALSLAILFIYFSTKVKAPKISVRYPFLIGLISTVLIFVIFVEIPHTSVPYFVPMLAGILVISYFYWSQEGMNMREQHAELLGVLSFWLLFYDLVIELNGMLGELPLGLATYFSIAYLYLKRYGRGFKKLME